MVFACGETETATVIPTDFPSSFAQRTHCLSHEYSVQLNCAYSSADTKTGGGEGASDSAAERTRPW